MRTVKVDASKKYDILLGSGLLRNAGSIIKERFSPCKAAIITDDTVAKLYMTDVAMSLKQEGFDVISYTFYPGENSKCLNTYVAILEFLAQNELTKSDIVIALGGGIPGDIAGFAASTYLRGIGFIQIPTTLLAALDSSVGGKTAINLPQGKNLAGAFYQPDLVIYDIDTIKTLSHTILGDGIAEAVKYGMIADKKIFEALLPGTLEGEEMLDIIEKCVKIKAKVVAEDEFDNGTRQLLNFGHTVGHAIEKLSGYTISHGHAVGIGMIVVSKAAYKKDLSQYDCSVKLIRALRANNLPTYCEYSARNLYDAMLHDKKRRNDFITLILPKNIGTCYRHDINIAELEDFIKLGIEE